MCQIIKEAYGKCEIEIINDEKYLRINRKDLEIESGYKTWAQIFDKCELEKHKYRQELIPNTKIQRCRVFVQNDLAERKIKIHILSPKKVLELKKKLGFYNNKYSFDEKYIISALPVAFLGETMHTKYCVQNKRLNLYFFEHKFGIEIDEYGHVDKDFEYEQIRQLIIEEQVGCKIIRTDPDAADFNIYRIINQVRMFIKQSTIKLTRNSLIGDLSRQLLEVVIELESKYKEVKPNIIKKDC